MQLIPCILIFFLCFVSLLKADIKEDLLKGVLVEGVTIDLREPTFCEGVLTTEKGGVITAPGIRIQANKIAYTRSNEGGEAICSIEAESEVMIEFGKYVFIGDQLKYDFQTQTGVLFRARSGVAPWYFGGEMICLCADGGYVMTNGYVTTSETSPGDWMLTGEKINFKDQKITAKNINFRLGNIPLFWWPSFRVDLDSIFDNPISYTAGWGGRQGPRVGIIYDAFDWNNFNASVRLDYRVKYGPGGGIETYYHSTDYLETFETINYLARDTSIFIPNEHVRYRFQGAYNNVLCDGKLSVDLTYDKLSDKDMPTDYADRGLDIEDAELTQLNIRRQEDQWIANFLTRCRINSFETVKQELPTFFTTWHPFEIGSTGVISDNQVELSYLNFVYTKGLPRVHDYNATRIGMRQKLYRPIQIGPAVLTPEAGSTTIFYGNSPGNKDRGLVMGLFECDLRAPFFRFYPMGKHVIEPYMHYSYYTFPTVNPNEHYIFDINDGWYRLNMLRFGANQSWYMKDSCGNIRRLISADLYANAFFDTETIPQTIPKVYAQLQLNSTETLRHCIDTAWDFEENQIDHFNFLNEWTANANFAVSFEYRYRSSFDWRKVDRDNFILDSFRSIEELRHSQESDKRDTFLLHFFYRFHPNWAIEYEARHGWHRRHHEKYNEFEIDLLASLPSTIQMRFVYQHRVGDDAVAVHFTVGAQRPDRLRSSDLIPFLEF